MKVGKQRKSKPRKGTRMPSPTEARVVVETTDGAGHAHIVVTGASPATYDLAKGEGKRTVEIVAGDSVTVTVVEA